MDSEKNEENHLETIARELQKIRAVLEATERRKSTPTDLSGFFGPVIFVALIIKHC